MKKNIFLLLALALWARPLDAPSKPPSSQEHFSLEKLSWMVGNWRGYPKGGYLEEHWSTAAGKTMLGMSRLVVKGKTTFYEFMKIQQYSEGIFLTIDPLGRRKKTFRLIRLEKQEAVFENPTFQKDVYDFPKKVIYRLGKSGSLMARIEGPQEGKIVGETFWMEPMKPPKPTKRK
ncbi:MAG: hypothetical protein HY399_06945 [Elusimicrobia bacterium]|nr:hypothetical protein [Elusimicrobiota bacterium]